MKLEHLRAFEAVARVGHFTRAAEELFLAQPSLSRQIAGLEADLGQELFDRGRGGATLTHAGEVLLPIARRMLADAEAARAEMDELAGLRRGRVRLGAPPTLCVSVLTEVIATFREAHPGVALEVMEAGSHALAQALAEGRLDLALTIDRGPIGPAVSSEALFTEELVVASARKGTPLPDGGGLAQGAPVTPAPGLGEERGGSRTGEGAAVPRAAGLGRAALFLGTGAPDARDGHGTQEDAEREGEHAPSGREERDAHPMGNEQLMLSELAHLPLVAFNRSYDLRQATDAAFEAAGLEASVAVEGAEMDAVLRFVERGIGVAVVPATILLGRPGLKGTRLIEPALTRTAALSIREGSKLSVGAQAVRETVLETVAKLTGPGAPLSQLVTRA